ncbi:MAG: alpha/beta hydrolase, partial [Bdellovibrionales bacterium]|nr:alpha/beta hydrolase [Bdellovibrionales bacterium]
LLEHFKNLSLDVLFVEYPGYAEDRKLPSQKELLENAKQLYLSLPSDKPIFLYGESLGAAVATHLAMLYPIKGLILQSPFTSVRALAQKIYPFLPIKWIIRYPLEQDQWAKTVNASVLILHGVRDEIVPYEMGKELNTFFRNSRLSSYETKGHNDITLNNPKMFEDVKRFINQTISPSP